LKAAFERIARNLIRLLPGPVHRKDFSARQIGRIVINGRTIDFWISKREVLFHLVQDAAKQWNH
jgi:hypothetical protein